MKDTFEYSQYFHFDIITWYFPTLIDTCQGISEAAFRPPIILNIGVLLINFGISAKTVQEL